MQNRNSPKSVWCRRWLALFVLLFLPVTAHVQAQTKQERSAVEEGRTVTSASLEGDVADPGGALIPGAHVRLQSTAGAQVWEATADATGRFDFPVLSPGSYELLVEARGFQSYTFAPVAILPGEARRLGTVSMKVSVGYADAYVTLNRKDIAALEVHAAEQQRIAGFPDFYTSFQWNAASLDSRQKLGLALRATTDRMAFVTAGLVASGEQLQGTFPGYGGGPGGFGKRYGAAYADGFIGKFVGSGLLPSILRQDPRYFYMGESGTTRQRVWHAVVSAFAARADKGHHLEPNYSHIVGNASAGALSTLYHPATESARKLALHNALLGTLGEAGVNVVRELLLTRFVRGGDTGPKGRY